MEGVEFLKDLALPAYAMVGAYIAEKIYTTIIMPIIQQRMRQQEERTKLLQQAEQRKLDIELENKKTQAFNAEEERWLKVINTLTMVLESQTKISSNVKYLLVKDVNRVSRDFACTIVRVIFQNSCNKLKDSIRLIFVLNDRFVEANRAKIEAELKAELYLDFNEVKRILKDVYYQNLCLASYMLTISAAHQQEFYDTLIDFIFRTTDVHNLETNILSMIEKHFNIHISDAISFITQNGTD